MTRRTKNIHHNKLPRQQEVGHFDLKFPFHPILIHFHASYFDKLLLQTSYTTDLQFTQYHPQTFNMKRYRNMVGDMQLKGEHTLRQHYYKSIIKTKLATNLFEGFFTCSPFCFLCRVQRVLLTSVYITYWQEQATKS